MKAFLRLFVLICIAFSAQGQYYTTTNTTGTVLYGTTNVTVVGGGTASSYASWCGAGPYWIGAGSSVGGTPSPGWYTFTFSSPASRFRVKITAADPGESITIDINGVHHSIVSSEYTAWASTCGTPAFTLSGDTLLSTGSNSSGWLDIAACDINSVRVATNGRSNGSVFTFMFSDSGSCFSASNNGPICEGDTLRLYATSVTSGATYTWYGPGGYTSTLQNPVRPVTSITDSGVYTVVQTIGGSTDTARTRVVINPKPVITASSNSPVCLSATLMLYATPVLSGVTFLWSGPTSFTSTLSAPVRTGFTSSDTGIYKVIATLNGCSDSAYTRVVLNSPPTPLLTGDSNYCVGETYVPVSVSGFTGSLLWYTTATGGTGTASPPSVNTSVPGTTVLYVSQVVSGCESERASITIVVRPLPAAPVVTGPLLFCPNDPYPLFTVTGTNLLWYMSATGGVGSPEQPIVDTSRPGLFTMYVSQADSFCSSPRTPVSITINPGPPPSVDAYLRRDICPGDTVSLGITSGSTNAHHFTWTFDGGIVVAHNSNSGGPYKIVWNSSGLHVISVTPYTVDGCPGKTVYDTVKTHNPPVAAIINPNPSGSMCLEDSLLLRATATDPSYLYEWSPSQYFADRNRQEAWGIIQRPGYIKLTVYSPYGCKSTDSVLISPDACCKVTFPTAFTPNGDGRNDVFRPIFNGFHRFQSFRISNRWGETVFESTNNNMAWDGTHNGVPQDMGVYFYFIKYDCGGKDIIEKGDVTLIK